MYYLLVFLFISILTTSISEGYMPKVPNLNEFLQKIQQIESSGGKDLDHPVVESGIQAGDAAIGRYGLMPNTVRELVNRRRLNGTSTGELKELAEMDSPTMKKHLEANPDLEDELANQMATLVTRRQLGDEDKAAYSWTNGQNLSPDQISDEQLDNSPYVQKYRKLKDIMGDEQ